MAKSGTVTATGGANAPLKAAVAASDPRVSNLGSVVADAMSEWPTQAIFVVDTKQRTVSVCNPVAGITAAIAAIALQKDQVSPHEAKRSTTWDYAAFDSGVLEEDLLAIVGDKPSTYTLSSIISAIEDAAAAKGKDVIIVADQTAGTVMVHQGTPAQVDDEDIAATLLAVNAGADVYAQFTQTVEASTGPKDPFE